MFSMAEQQRKGPVIKVIGVGGCGRNAVAYMLGQSIVGACFACANTDAQAMIDDSDTAVNIQLGRELTKGLGAGARPDVGREAALETKDELIDFITDTDLLFIAAGMGGGTGTGAAPIVAQLAREHDVLTVAVVTTPFRHERGVRASNATLGVTELKKHANSMIIIDNQKLVDCSNEDLSIRESMSAGYLVLGKAVQCITEVVTRPGMINVDFADLENVMKESGMAIIASGEASGTDRAKSAVDAALNSPLVTQSDINNCRGLLLNVTCSENSTRMSEFDYICDSIHRLASDDATIIEGLAYDDSLGDSLRVSLVATGLDEAPARSGPGRPLPSSHPNRRYSPGASRKFDGGMRRFDGGQREGRKDDSNKVPQFLLEQAD